MQIFVLRNGRKHFYASLPANRLDRYCLTVITIDINCWFGVVVKYLPADWMVAGSRPGHVRFFQSQNFTVYD